MQSGIKPPEQEMLDFLEVKVLPSNCLLLLLNNLIKRTFKNEILWYVVCYGYKARTFPETSA